MVHALAAHLDTLGPEDLEHLQAMLMPGPDPVDDDG